MKDKNNQDISKDATNHLEANANYFEERFCFFIDIGLVTRKQFDKDKAEYSHNPKILSSGEGLVGLQQLLIKSCK